MSLRQLVSYVCFAGAVSLVVHQPVQANVGQVTGVRLNPTENGLEVILDTSDATPSQVFASRYGNTFVADIINTQLKLPGKTNTFRQENPTSEITAIIVTALDANTVRIRIEGKAGVPTAKLVQNNQRVVFSLTPPASTAVKPAQPNAAPPVNPPTTPTKPPATTQNPNRNTQADSTEELSEERIIVRVTRTQEELTDVPRSVTVIDREQIEEQAQSTRDLGNILGKLVPGLAPPTQTNSNFGQSLRGRNVLVLIDGVPQSTSRNVFRDFSTIDPSAVERIEVLRGPTAIYGDGATGGVANIITRTASEEKVTSTTEVGLNAS